jgi:hypothetical protein
LVSIELLLTDREQELLAAVHTLDGFVFERSHDAISTSETALSGCWGNEKLRQALPERKSNHSVGAR